MSIPILGQVFDLVGAAIDKVWPDANTKEQAKAQVKMEIMQQAMAENKLLFEDTAGARDLFKSELEAQRVPGVARFIQVLARPFVMYSCTSMYVFNKISPLFKGPEVALTEWDYYLIGTIFVFLFGARTLEKLKKSA